jgi:hypothetical protein
MGKIHSKTYPCRNKIVPDSNSKFLLAIKTRYIKINLFRRRTSNIDFYNEPFCDMSKNWDPHIFVILDLKCNTYGPEDKYQREEEGNWRNLFFDEAHYKRIAS